jgi:hypothetical protein
MPITAIGKVLVHAITSGTLKDRKLTAPAKRIYFLFSPAVEHVPAKGHCSASGEGKQNWFYTSKKQVLTGMY